MSLLYTFILITLGILAVLGIVVGVTNDAVNFLNSALASKAAPRKIILLVASVGILTGVMTSSGMMEVARSGVFFPAQFTFREIMFLFLGMMLGNVILLDVFNSLGLPTSTTVSMVFGLLGAAMALALYKIGGNDALTMADMGKFINSGRALVIVSAILISVVVAFVTGSVLMYLSRLIFSFRYNNMLRKFGALWCGVSFAGIVYFAIFKGLHNVLSQQLDASFISWIDTHGMLVLLGLWVFSSIMLYVLQLLKVNILKTTIMAGTFSLALAFAGNDLVNFIGVPFAGFDSYRIAHAAGTDTVLMSDLMNPVKANFWIMLSAGVVMVLTIFFSPKALAVTQTELSLANQNESEEERYSSTFISRGIVRAAVAIHNGYEHTVPRGLREAIDRRFEPLPPEERAGINYDLIRATVNLTASSLLIAFATSLKLPLSTTYVVFMVSMGSSLADRAWGRESAVYRITGVMTVISGWFVTAFAGFIIALGVTLLLVWGNWIAAVLLTAACLFLVIRGNFFKKREDFIPERKKPIPISNPNKTEGEVLIQYIEDVCVNMEKVTRIYGRTIVAVFKENRKVLRDMVKESNDLFYAAREQKYAMLTMVKNLQEHDIATAPFYVQVVDYMSETTKALIHITRPAFDHINNNHHGFTKDQIVELKEVNDAVEEIFSAINVMLRSRDFSNMSDVLERRDRLFDMMDGIMKSQLHRMQQEPTSTSASILFFNILNETKTMVLQSRNIMKSLEHFVDD